MGYAVEQSIVSRDSLNESMDEAREYLIATGQYKQSQWPKRAAYSIIVALILLNIGQIMYTMELLSTIHTLTTSPNGLSTIRNKARTGTLMNKFSLVNETEAGAAWESIEAGHGMVAVDRDWAASQSLPDTESHPGDSNKAVYVMEAYHNMHCLKMIRRHYIAIESGQPMTWPRQHDIHYFDSIHQYIMCEANDSLLKTTLHRDAGEGQTRMCRDWDALREWATRHTACYHDEFPAQWGRCDGGDDGLPVGSLLAQA